MCLRFRGKFRGRVVQGKEGTLKVLEVEKEEFVPDLPEYRVAPLLSKLSELLDLAVVDVAM